MTSLTTQMEALQKQQADLAEKIKLEEEKKLKETFTIERLEAFNKGADTRRNKLARKSNRSISCTAELITLNHTKPRLDIILEIFKKQDARIAELEDIITSTKSNKNITQTSTKLQQNFNKTSTKI